MLHSLEFTSFPLNDVQIFLGQLEKPSGKKLDENTWIAENYFFLDVPETARFEVKNGNSVCIELYPEANHRLLYLYLHGSVLAALFHQRKQLILHASSFIHDEKAILICGESEVGKSSLNLAFCLDGKAFLNDDISPFASVNDELCVFPLGLQAKLWKDSFFQLNLETQVLEKIEDHNEKYFYPVLADKRSVAPSCIFILETDVDKVFSHRELKGAEKWETLLPQIYRREYLSLMPESSAETMKQLLQLLANTSVFFIQRPKQAKIRQTKLYLEKIIEKLYL